MASSTSSSPGSVPGRQVRAPRALNVVRNPRPEEIDAPIDWSPWYLSEDEDMGEGGEQQQIILIFLSVLRQLARERSWGRVHIGSDQFFAWLREEPLVRVSPDVYLLDDPPDPPLPDMWQTWRSGHRPPRFAVEIVSGADRRPDRWRKDYDEGPAKYSQLGTSELVVFDPEPVLVRARSERVPLQVYRREADGSFVRAYAGDGPARSAELDAWLVATAAGPVARLRLARGPAGGDLVPTEWEARDAAEVELGRLRAELERLQRGR